MANPALRLTLLVLVVIARPSPAPPVFASDAAVAAEPFFTDLAPQLGLDFVHFNGMSGEFYFPEMTGQGGALLDFDNDGDLDAYLVQGAMLGPGKTLADALFPPTGDLPPRDRLFRNDGVRQPDGTWRPQFVDVTDRSGIRSTEYGMGVAVADVDNDGDIDLYVTNYGPNRMWRNDGDGSFTDITEAAAVGDPLWGTSASFFDLDGDGWLDLYLVNYVEFDIEANPRCFARSSRRDYCGPEAFKPQPDRLYRNRGDGTFTDVTHLALHAYEPGPGLGVVTADLNHDGRVDIYVANDGQPNQLWLNRGDGSFREEALMAGVAVNREGRSEASMGVDAGDYDGDGDEDLFITHLMEETNTLYVNDGSGLFEDRTVEAGLAANSLAATSFGTGWLDFDNDRFLDLLVLSGAVRVLESQAAAGDPFPLRQPNQLFRNLAGEKFEEVSRLAGDDFEIPEVSRGAAFGDVDNDGDVDVLLLNNNGPARLLVNRVGERESWLGLRVLERSGGAALGSRLSVTTGDGATSWRRARSDGSYCSASDSRVLFGLDRATRVVRLTVDWPNGGRARWHEAPRRRYLTLSPRRDRGPSS